MTKSVALIPARMASTRFPGKPLAKIHGYPMIEHVFRAVSAATVLTDTFVATCDIVIRDAVESFGGRALITGGHHERASDRCAEAIELLEKDGRFYDIVVMVQGDEPMTHPAQIDEVLAPFSDDSVEVVNLYSELTNDEAASKNAVKVVVAQSGDALYFSRQPIPGSITSPVPPTGKQLGLIAFRTDALKRFSRLEPTPYETCESVDMLRFLEHGMPVRMQFTHYKTVAVDTIDDLEMVSTMIVPPIW